MSELNLQPTEDAIENAVVKADHEPIVNDESSFHPAFAVGDIVHQGDVMIVGIDMPDVHKLKPRQNRQLADGSTQGARHVLERGDVYECDPDVVAAAIKKATGIEVEARFVGPVFVSPESPTADDLTHPEHGNHGFPAGQVCAVVYQRNLDAEERTQRSAD